MKKKPKIVSIVGLTASGKSAVGMALAREFNGEIISCDSRQVYRRLDIGTAKVTAEEQAQVRHHLLDVVEPLKEGEATRNDNGGFIGAYNVFDFQKAAYSAIDDILARGKNVFLVGGTGLYSRSIVEGYNFKEQNNVSLQSKKASQTPMASTPKYEVLQICLMPSKEYIAGPIARRIDERLNNGLIEETRGLLADGYSRDFLASLGLEYYWNIEYIEGRVTLEEYKYWLHTKTMQFAKRQRTWFKREKDTVFLDESSEFSERARELVAGFLK